uniref:Reverse transcriptase domain-containing protein n=1 Tax=Tanacetum cinerariifolium TaxID=118510 RepID=A0A6L2K4G4_TANCI|nr:reverse transcriptase domain-containing protein [Tanacetum cinerariifolium]
MRTRSSSNLPVVSSNPSTSNPKHRNRRRSKQPFILEESPIDTMADQCTMAELLRAPIEGAARRWLEKEPSHSIHTLEDLVSKFINKFFPPSRTINLRNQISNFQQRFDESFHEAWDRYKDLLRAFPHHGFTELHQLDTFYNALNPADQDSLNAVVGGNLLKRRTQDVLTIIENKSKVRNSQNKSVVSQVKSCDANSNSSSEIAKLTHAINQQTSAETTVAILKQFQATPPTASLKVVEEICVTYGGAHPYYQCLTTGGNTFPELWDNIQGYVSAAAVYYNKRNPFIVLHVWLIKFDHQQNQIVLLNELEKVKRMNEANMKAMQTQINIMKNKLRNEMKIQFSGIVLDGPTVPTLFPFINPEEDERVEETLTDPDLSEYTIKVPPPPVQKYKPPSQREYVVHQMDPLHPNIPYPSRMLKQKQQEKNKVQIHKFLQMFKQLHINITLAGALILMPKYQKMLKAILSNKEKLQELVNTHLNENCSAVILKKLLEKLKDPGKFLIPCGFSELKCKALADLGASINLMPLSIWKKLGLPELISTRMTLELASRAICTPARIARDVFVPTFLTTTRALIDVHSEEMILHDGDERLILNMRHDTSSYSNRPRKESINLINVFNDSSEDFLEDLFSINQPSDLHPPLHVNPLSGSTTYFSSFNPLLEELADELALITFPPKYDDDLQFDVEFDLKEIEFLLHQDIDSSLKDSVDQNNLANLTDNFVDSMPEMFTDEHALDYSSLPIFNEYDDDFLKVETDTENVYDDPFNSNGEKIKESKLLIDELDLPCDFLPFEYDSFISQDFSRVDSLPSTNNEDKVFNPGILSQENPFKIIIRVVEDKKLASYNASLVL